MWVAMVEHSQPTAYQRVLYLSGKKLPDAMQAWVRDDLTGAGASVRQVLRFVLPTIAVLSLFLLLPGPRWIPLAMMALLLIPVLYFSIALEPIYRRHKLLVHGLDPELLNLEQQRRADRIRRDYELRHGGPGM